MEESLKELYSQIINSMGKKAQLEPNEYSPLVLAYIGDCIYELTIRSMIVSEGNKPVNKLNSEASSLSRAQTQAAILHAVKDMLTPEEFSVYKRGRNARSYTKAKNASMNDYRHATGFEALCGYLYLCGKTDRMLQIVNEGMKLCEANTNNSEE